MEIMNILWDEGKALSTHAIIAKYPEPRPAYSTIAMSTTTSTIAAASWPTSRGISV